MEQELSHHTKAIRIAMVGPPLNAWFGGQEQQADALLNCWRDDPAVTVRFVSSRPALPQLLAGIGRIRGLRTMARFPIYLADLGRAAHGVDVFQVFAASSTSFLIATAPAFVIGRLLKKKILIHYHSGQAERHLRESVLARSVLRSCSLVAVPSAFLERVFLANHIHSVVVPNVIDPARFAFRSREPFRPKFLCTRNFEAHYGVDLVVRAFARIQAQFPDAQLCLVGKGACENTLRRLVQDLALRNVDFKGAIDPTQMHTVYDQSDVFLNGSYVDCSPVSILESSCSGLPVVTTAPGGIPYLVEHERTGLLSAPGDAEALAANAIRILQQQDFARSLARCARQRAESHAWSNLRELWLRTYRSLLG